MTTLKELFMSRACKIGLTALLVASMVPVAALSAAPAYAENDQPEQAVQAAETETLADEQAPSRTTSDEPTDGDDAADAAIDERSTFGAEAENAGETPEGEPIEGDGAAIDAEEEAEEELSVSDLQLESLETTVEEPWSFFSPLRLLFGAADTFSVPLKSGNYADWIDRLDLSGAPYALPFYDILAEASDNDGEKDWLIDNIGFSPAACTVLSTTSPASRATVGNVYRVNSTTSGILAAIVDDDEAATAGSDLTDTEQRVKKYINEVYGAFDRDFPTSFWRDVSFGTVFVRDKALKKTLCFFALKSGTFDLRAQGYRSATDIKNGIATIDSRVNAINAAFDASDLPNKDSDYARVKFYNQWICENNQYNTKFNSVASNATALKEFQAANPDVWSAMSALSGRTGETGPVCEGYSRAMKLLCDDAGIGCVLVDGNTTAGPHMWNYVRIGSEWYGVDITWNNTGIASDYERYLLVGADTVISGSSFLASHPATNQFASSGIKFTNGPVLSAEAYDPNNVSFAGIITSSDTFAYGDSFALAYNSTTEGTVEYEVKSGPATIESSSASTPAQVAAVGSGPLLTVTGLGEITVSVTLTPGSGSRRTLTDTITVTGVPRPLQVTGTELAAKVYDGTTDAAVLTAGRLVSARPSLSYASVGVLEGDTVELDVKSAAFADKNAGTNKAATATYELTGDAATVSLYTLEGHEADTTATGTIAKRPATAHFALTSTRMLLDEEPPRGTVRYEAFASSPTARGVVEGDDLALTSTDIVLDGMPDPLTPGTYDVTWAKPNSYVLDAINKLPAAANYDIALAEGDDDVPAVLEVVNLANTVVVPAEDANGSMQYRVEARMGGINGDTVTKLADSGFTSTDDIVKKLVETLQAQTDDLDANRVTIYDMTLYVRNAEGAWEEATVDNFPADGVRVTLDYPEDTAATKNSFFAAHMFTAEVTSGGTVHKPGEVESPQVLNTEDGPSFTLMGFSPVSLAWNDTPPTTTAGSASNGSGLGGNTVQAGMSTVDSAGAGLNATGDSILAIAIVALVVVVCVALIAFMMIRRKKDRRP